VTQQTLGVFLGTFSYCVAALPAARSVPQPFAPILTVLGAMVLALACVAWLLFFIHHISQAISVNHIVDKIATETEAIIDETMPASRRSTRMAEADLPEPSEREGAVSSHVSGYVRFIDVDRLVFLAKSYGVAIRVIRRVGHFVPAGVPLMTVSKGERLSPARNAELCGAFDVGPTRTLQQDIEFGILQIVDIALRAISPAVNDPSTAINCVDQLSRILIRFGSREEAASRRYDPPGVLRVSIPWRDFDQLVDAAFEQIRLYARADIAVSLRLLRALADIAATIPEVAVREKLVERARQIVAGCAEELGEEELGKLRLRLAALERLGMSSESPARARSASA
jgi:uncharacterized membrane protein